MWIMFTYVQLRSEADRSKRLNQAFLNLSLSMMQKLNEFLMLTCVVFHEFEVSPLCYQLLLSFTKFSLRQRAFSWLWDFLTSFWAERVKLFWGIHWKFNTNDANYIYYLITCTSHFLVICMKNTSSVFKNVWQNFQIWKFPGLINFWDCFSIYQCSPNQNTY